MRISGMGGVKITLIKKDLGISIHTVYTNKTTYYTQISYVNCYMTYEDLQIKLTWNFQLLQNAIYFHEKGGHFEYWQPS
jgi:hypothetical protein